MKKTFVIALLLILLGFFMKDKYLSIDIHNTYFLINYFYVAIFISVIFLLVSFLFRKKLSKHI